MVRTGLFYSAAALLLASSAQALESVTNWGGSNPSNLKLDIYVPRNKAPSPALILAVSLPTWDFPLTTNLNTN